MRRTLAIALSVLFVAALPLVGEGARDGRPLPGFSGTTLTGKSVSVSELLGRRLLVFAFQSESRDGKLAAEALSRIAGLRSDHNFEILGAARGNEAFALLDRFGFDFPILQDPDGVYSTRLGGQSAALFVLADSEGFIARGTTINTGGRTDSDAVDDIEKLLRDWLRLPRESELGSSHFESPEAPNFTSRRLDGEGSFELASARGTPVVLVFFLHTCPHCHSALQFFKAELAKLPEDKRPIFIGISLRNEREAVERSLDADGLRFFDVYTDPARTIQEAYGGIGGVPATFLIDREGRIVSRVEGWRRHRESPLMSMKLAKLAGSRIPMLLDRKGYSGNEFCVTCHPTEHDTWSLTSHATAYETLLRHGAERNEECVGCHVVGWEKPGGFSLDHPAVHLEGVGCESCHGRGGPHLSPNFVVEHDYAPVCTGCHDAKHSLGFDYASFVPRVSHAANVALTSLSAEERRDLLERQRKSRTALLPDKAAYVGSAACQACHAAEHATWSEQPHARAGATLEGKGQGENADCLTCHTTAFGKEGGFPTGASLDDHGDLAAVGCESCHGPGGDHIGESAQRIGTILSLGDKCDSCVILQICGSCHDDANDPGFEFEVQEKIDRQRHGTIEPAAERSASEAALRAPVAALEHAFRVLDAH